MKTFGGKVIQIAMSPFNTDGGYDHTPNILVLTDLGGVYLKSGAVRSNWETIVPASNPDK